MKQMLIVIGLFCSIWCNAQKGDSSSVKQLQQVVVTGYIEKSSKKPPINIDAFHIDSINKYGSYNLTTTART